MLEILKLKSIEDVVANIVFQNVRILEEKNSSLRKEALGIFQSEFFMALNGIFSKSISQENYNFFSVFNKMMLKKVSPKIREDKRIKIWDFTFQPILRFIFARPGNTRILDPNYVYFAMGHSSFVKMYKQLFLEISLLEPFNVDRIITDFINPKTQGISPEAVRFAFSLKPFLNDISNPLVPGSDWSLERIFMKISYSENFEMLREFYYFSSQEIRSSLKSITDKRCPSTGLLKFPWANEALGIILRNREEYAPGNFLSVPGETISPLFENSTFSNTMASEILDNYEPIVGRLLPEERIFLIENIKGLILCFRQISEINLISMNFYKDSETISLATDNSAYVIDFAQISQDEKSADNFLFVLNFVINFLLCEKSFTKIIYSLESFLEQISRYFHVHIDFEERQHFENLIDLRKPRIKKAFKVRSPQDISAVDIESKLFECSTFHEMVRLSNLHKIHMQGISDLSVSGKFTEEVEVYSGYRSLRSMYLDSFDIHLPHGSGDSLALRPLKKLQVIEIANQCHALVQLEIDFRRRGFLSHEILTI